MRNIYKIAVMIFMAVSLQTSWAKPSDIPVEDFFKNPEFSGMQISPDGKHIAVLSPINNRRNIVIIDTEGLKNTRQITGLVKQDIAGFFWANNKDIVFTMDSDGNEAFSLFKVDSTKKKPRVVQLVGSTAGASGIRSASTVHLLPDDPDHILVQFNGRKVKAPDIYKLPLKSSWNTTYKKNRKMKLIARNPGDVQGWIIDNDGNVRGAMTLNGLKGKFLYKEADEKEFRVLREGSVLDEGISPLGFDFDNKTMYVSSNIGRDRSAIYKFDPQTNKLGELVFAHDEVDVSGLIMSRKQQKLLGVVANNEYPEFTYFDKDFSALMNNLRAAFPDKQVNITSQSRDEMKVIVLVNNDNDPGEYFLFDRNKNSLVPVLKRMDWLKPKDMSHMKPIKFTSRDGMEIRGYLTIPINSDGKKLPLIINPHGGPFGVRDSWGFNPEHQFFASRGYATVQVNYRGSGGYGRKFEQAGYGGKWGAEMQNDLTDAVKYLIKEGIADADKVCIYGGSYGGYATMAGLTFTPDLYKCGVNYVGVTDISLLFSSMPKHWEPAKELMKIQIGDPTDEALMERMSPLAHVDKIKAPLMIIQGARDPRVVKQHATDLRDALEDRGIELTDDEWIMKKNEGHGFRKEENRLELYTKMEKFLAKHLK